MPSTNTTARPVPPENLDGEALLEWHRACDELDGMGRLDRVDRAILTQYVRTWAENMNAARHVEQFGSVIKWGNGLPGPNPFYKVWMETGKRILDYLDRLGLTPAARGPNGASGDGQIGEF